MNAAGPDVVVVGAGVAGLAAAYEAQRTGARVVVLEASERAGGKIAGVELAGVAMDGAADAFLARVPWARELCADLGIDGELVAPGTGQAWLWVRGRLRPIPAGLVLGVPSRWGPVARSGVLSWRGLTRLALDELRPVRVGDHDDTIANTVGAHLGLEAVERLVDPLVGGINAGDCWELSVDAVTPQLAGPVRARRLMRALRASTEAGSTGGANPGRERAAADTGTAASTAAGPVFLTPRGGMVRLIEALTDALGPGVLHTATPARAVGPGWVATDAGTLSAARIVLATPAPVNARLLAGSFPEAAAAMGELAYNSVSMALIGYPRAEARLPPGSGLLVPRTERRLMTAASWYDQKWPHRRRDDLVVARVSAGRSGDRRHEAMDDDELVAVLHAELSRAVATVPGCSLPDPAATLVVRWPDAFPQYRPGHRDWVERVRARLAAGNVLLAGAAYDGVGIAACVRAGREAGRQAASATAVSA